jgi:hypothetical protein
VARPNSHEPRLGRSAAREAFILVSLAGIVLCGIWLLRDATTYAIRPADLAMGRVRGCYTAIDRVLGRKPSESGLSSGTRLAELVISLAAVFFTSFFFVRRLRRSPFNLPLTMLAGGWAMWLAGGAFFWHFHNIDVYLTWRLIGNTPNEFAEKATAAGIVALNVIVVTLLWCLSKRKERALRFAVYASLLGYLIAAVLHVLVFAHLIELLAFSVPLLFTPVIAFMVGSTSADAG